MKKRTALTRSGEVFEITELEVGALSRVAGGVFVEIIDDVNVSSGCTTNFGCMEGCANNCPPGCGG